MRLLTRHSHIHIQCNNYIVCFKKVPSLRVGAYKSWKNFHHACSLYGLTSLSILILRYRTSPSTSNTILEIYYFLVLITYLRRFYIFTGSIQFVIRFVSIEAMLCAWLQHKLIEHKSISIDNEINHVSP